MPTINAGTSPVLMLPAGQRLAFAAGGAGLAVVQRVGSNPVPMMLGATPVNIGPYRTEHPVSINCERDLTYVLLPATPVSSPPLQPVAQDPLTGQQYAGGSPVLGAGIRQIATRCRPNDNTYAGFTSSRSRTTHRACDEISSIQVAWANWYILSGVDADGSSPLTITASIEYPVGVFTQLKFGGAATGVIAAGSTGLSDIAFVSIPRGATFWVRSWQQGTNLLGSGTTQTPSNAAAGDKANFSNAAVLADPTMTDTGYTWGAPSPVSYPAAIVGLTSQRAVLLSGDSLSSGSTDVADALLASGFLERAVTRKYGTINISRSGESAAQFNSNGRYRKLLAQWCTDVMVHYGTNELAVGNSVASIQTAYAALVTTWAGKPVRFCTVLPRTTSTDAWVTVVNQTPYAVNSFDTNRLTLNASIRDGSGTPGASPYVPSDTVFASAARASTIAVLGGTAATTDGLHPNAAMNNYMGESLALQF